MDKRRYGLLLVVFVFVGAAIWLSQADDENRREPLTEEAKADESKHKANFPRDYRRQRRRADAPLANQRMRKKTKQGRDPLEAAVLAPGGSGGIFVEVNAIRHAPVAEKILRCREGDGMDGLARMKEDIGIDPLEDIDRIALTEDVFAAGGFFEGLTLPPERVGEGRPYGDDATLYDMPAPDGSDRPNNFIAVAGNDMILIGEDEAKVQAAVDRLEGRAAPAPPPKIRGARGEIYGTVGKAFLAGLLAKNEGDPLVKRLTEIVDDGVVRMNVDENVSLSVDLATSDSSQAKDLGQAMAGAFAGFRMQAQAEGNERLAKLLEQARVKPNDDGSIALDVAVPGELFLEALGCDADGNPVAVKGPAPVAASDGGS